MTSTRVGQRLVLLAGLAALIGLGIWLVSAAGSGDDGVHADEEPTDDTPVAPVPITPAGPNDALESLQLPITVEPGVGLVDEQFVSVGGSGFTPGATIALVQCWLTETGGTRDDCDLGNIAVATADSQGGFEQPMQVRTLIGTLNGERDCRSGEEAAGCRIGVGNVENLDESGGVAILFDEQLPGDNPATISVDTVSGLRNGDAITVTGSGFAPDETIEISQCPVGGMNDASYGCLARNSSTAVAVGPSGGFTVELAAARITQSVDGTHDCALDIRVCHVVVRSSRSPNPVPLHFDGSVAAPAPTEYTITPSDGLVDGLTVRLEIFDAELEGASVVQQCADAGPAGIVCAGLGPISISDGHGVADVTVRQFLVAENGTEIDCAAPARICYLDVPGPLAEDIRGPLYFAVAGEG